MRVRGPLDRRWEAMTRIEHLIRYPSRASNAADDEPVVLVVGWLAEKGGWGHFVWKSGQGVR